MPKIYLWRCEVRSYELDGTGKVRPATFLNYFEEGAWKASADGGYSPGWYAANHRIWVVRKMTLRYFEAAVAVTMGDQLELRTWVSDFKRVQSHREYDLRRLSDGARVVRARGNWAFLNTETMLPERLPEQVILDFAPDNIHEDLDASVHDPTVIEQPVTFSTARRVELRDLDSVGHVNNAVYLAWAEQALTDALEHAGWSADRLSSSDFIMFPISDEIEYLQSTQAGQSVSIATRLIEVGHDRAAWQHEISHEVTGEMIAKVISVRAFRDAQGTRSIPDALHLSMVQPDTL